MIYSICVNGFEVCRYEKVQDYITCMNAIFATFLALHVRYDFKFNTYHHGDDSDRTLSVTTDI